ncbi:MAG: GMC oxidoreductase [Sphingomonas sp.]
MLTEGIAGLGETVAEVIVVGSGPVGLALATDLARRGIRVLVLESGSVGGNASIQALSDASLSDPSRHDDMSIAVARRLGGTSNLWGARCLPFDPVDFEARPFVAARWPLAYEDVAPYWAPALRAACAGEAVFKSEPTLNPTADSTFSADTLERWANIQSAQVIHKEAIRSEPTLEVRSLATVTGFRFAENGRVAALEVSHSLSGERVEVPVKSLVLASGGLETARLLLSAQCQSANRFGGANGPLGRYYMGHVLGEIADIVFSSPALSRAFDFQIDGGSYVRRRLVPSAETQREHQLLNAAFWPVVAPVADPRHRSSILSMVFLALSYGPLGRLITAEAIRRRHIPDTPDQFLAHIANVLTGVPSAVSFAAKFLQRRYFSKYRQPGFFVLNRANRYGLSYHSEHAPEPTSRVCLNGRADRLGVPSLGIDLRFSEQDVDSVVRTHDLLEAWLVRSGIGRLEFRMPKAERHAAVLAQAMHGTHQIGLTRMGADRRSGVVDGDLRSFDASNLYVASTSVLPTSSQANPTLTAIALALRLADHLAAELQQPAPASILTTAGAAE